MNPFTWTLVGAGLVLLGTTASVVLIMLREEYLERQRRQRDEALYEALRAADSAELDRKLHEWIERDR
jgi:hypothetical protein